MFISIILYNFASKFLNDMTRYYQIETSIRKIDEDANTMVGWNIGDSNIYPYEFEPNEYYPTPSSVLDFQNQVYNIKELTKEEYESFEKTFNELKEVQDEIANDMACLQSKINVFTDTLWASI